AFKRLISNCGNREGGIRAIQSRLQAVGQRPRSVPSDFAKVLDGRLGRFGGSDVPAHPVGPYEKQPFMSHMAQIENSKVIFLVLALAKILPRCELPRELGHS